MAVGVAAFREVEARRRERAGGINVLELLLNAYLAAVLSVVAFAALSAVLAGPRVAAADADTLLARAPATVGLLWGVALVWGTRTGRRGGPITLEHATVRHVLLAPIPRAPILRRAALVQWRFALFLGCCGGAAIGLLAARQLPGPPFHWIALLTASGALGATLWAAAGLTTSGWRLGRVTTASAVLLTAGAVMSAVVGKADDPLSAMAAAGFAIMPRRIPEPLGPAPVVGLGLLVALAVAAIAGTQRVVIEQMERRARLVSLLWFSATMRDLRAVVLFRRGLVDETSRSRPWVRLPGRGRWSVWRRGWHGALRWPAVRWLRVATLGVVVAYATAAAIAGVRGLVIVAAAAQFILAVEATEALSQDADHPTLRRSYPLTDSALWARHLWMASVLVAAADVVGVLAVAALVGTQALGALVLVVPCAVAACAQAAWVSVREPLTPEMLLIDTMGFLQAKYVVGPVVVAGSGPIALLLTADTGQALAVDAWLRSAAAVTLLAAATLVVLLTKDHYWRERVRSPLHLLARMRRL